jgi:Zn-dependent peptidase ImmA (M78 family)
MKKRRSSIEAQAQALLDELGVRGIPVAVDRIAKGLGARVSYSPLDEELSGMIFIKDDIPIIGVNSLHHPNRQRFTLAHEIAHLRLHRDHITEAVHVDRRFAESVLRRDPASATGTQRLEIEANQFAAALLLPRSRLEELLDAAELDIEDERALEYFARKFKVSKATLQYRIRNLAGDDVLPNRRQAAGFALSGD